MFRGNLLVAFLVMVTNLPSVSAQGTQPCIAGRSLSNCQNTGDTQSGVGSSTSGSQETAVITVPSGGGSINKGAKDSSSDALMGAGMNAALATYFAGHCGKKNPYACMMAVISAKQAAEMMKGKGGADYAAGQTQIDGGGGYNVPGSLYENGESSSAGGAGGITDSGESGRINKEIGDLSNKLRESGVVLSKDNKSVKLADGREVPLSALGSSEAMAAAGFSADEIAAAQAARQEAEAKMAKFNVVPVSTEGGGSGGGFGRGGSNADLDAQGSAFAGFNPKSMFGREEKDRGAASVAGMSKKMGNESIGVAADNIFDMVHRRYKVKSSQNAFME